MQLYSTKNKEYKVDLATAVLNSLPPDNGLYMPEVIPLLPKSFIDNLGNLSFQEISFTVAKSMIGDYISVEDIKAIVENSITFPAPVVSLEEDTFVLELFHGPSLAFKDFGARFMAQLMGYFNRGNDKELVILVATSGDTGGAVAAGFHNTAGIKVVILYPSGKVSPLQEKQLTTLGGNIEAIEVNGSFDDCQSLVKQAFLDNELNKRIRLSSANSINIARLIPQSFYYFEAYKQVKKAGDKIAFVVPSGNFGNLTAGLFAQRMGLPIDKMIAATNMNDIVPEYLKSGIYEPRPSVATISNAMDVGAPSNFVRMQDLFGSTWNSMAEIISGYAFDDAATRKAMQTSWSKHQYIMDPHGAVGYLAWKAFKEKNTDYKGIILETAHPSKFLEEVNTTLSFETPVPERLQALAHKEKVATKMNVEFATFKNYLIQRY